MKLHPLNGQPMPSNNTFMLIFREGREAKRGGTAPGE